MEYYPLVPPATLAADPTDRHPTLARNSPNATSDVRFDEVWRQPNDNKQSS